MNLFDPQDFFFVPHLVYLCIDISLTSDDFLQVCGGSTAWLKLSVIQILFSYYSASSLHYSTIAIRKELEDFSLLST